MRTLKLIWRDVAVWVFLTFALGMVFVSAALYVHYFGAVRQ